MAVGAIAALWLAAKVSVPFWPVPATLQTLTVFVLAGMLGLRLGMVAVAGYLALGVLGLPVFAGTPVRGIGLAYMTGPTAGYLVGFLVAALVIGALADRGETRRPFCACLAATLGTVIVMTLGWARLALLVGPEQALQAGVMPFIPAEAVKIALATVLMPTIWHLRDRVSR